MNKKMIYSLATTAEQVEISGLKISDYYQLENGLYLNKQIYKRLEIDNAHVYGNMLLF